MQSSDRSSHRIDGKRHNAKIQLSRIVPGRSLDGFQVPANLEPAQPHSGGIAAIVDTSEDPSTDGVAVDSLVPRPAASWITYPASNISIANNGTLIGEVKSWRNSNLYDQHLAPSKGVGEPEQVPCVLRSQPSPVVWVGVAEPGEFVRPQRRTTRQPNTIQGDRKQQWIKKRRGAPAGCPKMRGNCRNYDLAQRDVFKNRPTPK